MKLNLNTVPLIAGTKGINNTVRNVAFGDANGSLDFAIESRKTNIPGIERAQYITVTRIINMCTDYLTQAQVWEDALRSVLCTCHGWMAIELQDVQSDLMPILQSCGFMPAQYANGVLTMMVFAANSDKDPLKVDYGTNCLRCSVNDDVQDTCIVVNNKVVYADDYESSLYNITKDWLRDMDMDREAEYCTVNIQFKGKSQFAPYLTLQRLLQQTRSKDHDVMFIEVKNIYMRAACYGAGFLPVNDKVMYRLF